MLLLLPLCAQPPQEGGKRERPAPKNLKLLTPDDLMPTMRSFTVALGQRCNFCHVQGDFASDENHKKIVARRMIEMVRSINTQNFNGKDRVTCYTCHRGAQEPMAAPPAGGTPGN